MNYNYKTNFKTIKQAYLLVEKTEILQVLFTKLQDVNKDAQALDFDIFKIIPILVKDNTLNELCQLITGSDEDFEEREVKELESVILGFFRRLKELWGDLELAKMLKQLARPPQVQSYSTKSDSV